jgi:hypothetical protein
MGLELLWGNIEESKKLLTRKFSSNVKKFLSSTFFLLFFLLNKLFNANVLYEFISFLTIYEAL